MIDGRDDDLVFPFVQDRVVRKIQDWYERLDSPGFTAMPRLSRCVTSCPLRRISTRATPFSLAAAPARLIRSMLDIDAVGRSGQRDHGRSVLKQLHDRRTGDRRNRHVAFDRLSRFDDVALGNPADLIREIWMRYQSPSSPVTASPWSLHAGGDDAVSGPAPL